MLKNIFKTLPKPALSLSARPSREQRQQPRFICRSVDRPFSAGRVFDYAPCTWDEGNPARRPLQPSKKVRIGERTRRREKDSTHSAMNGLRGMQRWMGQLIEAPRCRFASPHAGENRGGASDREQRFRLSYTLGDFHTDDDVDEDDFSFEEPGKAASAEDRDAVPDAERKANSRRIAVYLERIQQLAEDVSAETAEELGSYGQQENPDEKARWLELYSDKLFESDEFGKLALDIKDDVESRFDRLPPDELEHSPTNWPLIWTFETEDRDEFLRRVRWFSSNHFCQFGRLLTPLVDGLRVQGPFKPLFKELQIANRLVLLDGQGLGHTAESVSSVSTKVTKRFRDIDLILLVDSAKQPMQAAPLALLRAAASAGCADRLLVAFSHFDQVKGDNLHTLSQKRNHVLASITAAVAGLRPTLGASVATALEHRLEEHVFLLGGFDREIGDIPPGVIAEMGKLLRSLQAAAVPAIPIEAAPIYALGGLELALRDAVDSFLRPWEARLGLASMLRSESLDMLPRGQRGPSLAGTERPCRPRPAPPEVFLPLRP